MKCREATFDGADGVVPSTTAQICEEVDRTTPTAPPARPPLLCQGGEKSRSFRLRCCVFACIVMTAFAAPIVAQSPAPERTEPIVVTVSGRALPLSSVSASVTVISREEIEASHAVNLAEVLTNVPGVHVSQSGGQGAL